VPIRADLDVFLPLNGDMYSGTGFAVTSDAPQEAVVAAVGATADRWMFITESGEDFSLLDFEAFLDAVEEGRWPGRPRRQRDHRCCCGRTSLLPTRTHKESIQAARVAGCRLPAMPAAGDAGCGAHLRPVKTVALKD
jgi:hypothetical protein